MPTRGSIAALPHDLPVRILDGSPDAILICDSGGMVRYWNNAAERVFGFRVTSAPSLDRRPPSWPMRRDDLQSNSPSSS